jgi:hypothetical protein
MANNLVPGGARPGWFMTRRSRQVHIEALETHALPLEPGQSEPVMAERWRGTLYMMDGIRPDTIKYWDKDGGADSLNHVATPDDLAILISEDPKPEPPKPAPKPAAIAQPEPKPEPKPEPQAATPAVAEPATESKAKPSKAA